MRSWRNRHTHDVEGVGFMGSLPPNAPDDVRSTGVRVSLISSRNLQIRGTVRFESATDDQLLPTDGLAA